MQCAAVSTQSGAMSVPPQKWRSCQASIPCLIFSAHSGAGAGV